MIVSLAFLYQLSVFLISGPLFNCEETILKFVGHNAKSVKAEQFYAFQF
mgnify:CR=1 FL=1